MEIRIDRSHQEIFIKEPGEDAFSFYATFARLGLGENATDREIHHAVMMDLADEDGWVGQ